jgi:hypothetical protein
LFWTYLIWIFVVNLVAFMCFVVLKECYYSSAWNKWTKKKITKAIEIFQ